MGGLPLDLQLLEAHSSFGGTCYICHGPAASVTPAPILMIELLPWYWIQKHTHTHRDTQTQYKTLTDFLPLT